MSHSLQSLCFSIQHLYTVLLQVGESLVSSLTLTFYFCLFCPVRHFICTCTFTVSRSGVDSFLSVYCLSSIFSFELSILYIAEYTISFIAYSKLLQCSCLSKWSRTPGSSSLHNLSLMQCPLSHPPIHDNGKVGHLVCPVY